MDAVFLKLLNMSITSSWLCLAVLLIRLLLKKAPKAISCALWALVGLRLLLPFSLESVLSLIPSAEPLPEDMLLSPTPTINSGIPVINEVVNPVISDSLAPTPGASVNPMQVITTVAGYVWVIGMIAMLVYMLASYLRVRSKVAEAAKLEGNVYECDRIDTPFILGVFRPRIYLPSSMSEGDRAFVIAHEQAHLRRLDHLWKPLGFVLLTVYWINPLLWLGYILLCRDIELACDEKVIRQLGTDVKKQYSEALINCSVPRRAISACPLAFGEVGVKGRIKSVLNYKKPAFWIILVAVVALVVTGVCFLTDPKTEVKHVNYTATVLNPKFRVGAAPSDNNLIPLRYGYLHKIQNKEELDWYLFRAGLSLEENAPHFTKYTENFFRNNTLFCYIFHHYGEGDVYQITEILRYSKWIQIRREQSFDDTEGSLHTLVLIEVKTKDIQNCTQFRIAYGPAPTLSEHPFLSDLVNAPIDYVYCDIDKDGSKDYCAITPGATQGTPEVPMPTFMLCVMDESRKVTKYLRCYYSGSLHLSFECDKSGKIYIRDEVDDSTVRDYYIKIEDDSIVLTENGETIRPIGGYR